MTAVSVAASAAVVTAPASAANLQVTNTNNTGPGSLRAQIVAANGTAAEDAITFASNVTGQITLGSTLPVTNPLRIQGPGAGALTLNGNAAVQIFDVEPLASTPGQRNLFALSGLTLANGSTAGPGGAIYASYADVQISDVVITGNKSVANGGALYVDSVRLAITDTQITGNKSTAGTGGAIYVDGDGNTLPTDTVSITGSRLTDNQALGGNGGAAYFDNATGGDVTITRSTLQGNKASGEGGGLFFFGHRGKATIRQSTLSGNTADDGGAIYFNSNDDPGYTADRTLLIENSTLAGNSASGEGGGLYSANDDGEPVKINNSTVVGNTAAGLGGGLYRNDFGVTLSSTIVAGNSALAPANADLAQDPGASGAFTSGNGIVGTVGAATLEQLPAGSNQLGVDPQVFPLADNGGPTLTMLPAATSPALDKGAANGLTEDQRGLPRTSGPGTDVGAVEVPNTTVTGAKLSGKAKQKQKGKKVVIKVKAGAGEQVDLAASGAIKVRKKKYTLKRVTAVGVPADAEIALKLKPKKKSASKKILAGKKKARVTVKVDFTDAEGNGETKSLKLKLK